MSKATNMLAILWLIRAGRRMTAQQLADELEIHVRTVYRCIDSLCASGVPIISDTGPRGGYRILEHFAESPLVFDMEEQRALVQASAFAREAGYPYQDALDRAVEKMKLYKNEKQRDDIERHAVGFAMIHPPIESKQQERLRLLEEAAADGATVTMTYEKLGGEQPSIRTFDPYGIVHWKGAWYTIGFCSLRKQLRNFRVDRILDLVKTELRFERPSDFSAKEHLLHELLPNDAGAESLALVRIRAHDHILDLLAQHWLFGHALVARDNGQADYRIGLHALNDYVPYFLLPYGNALTIVEPEELIDRMAEIGSELVAHYQSMRRDAKER